MKSAAQDPFRSYGNALRGSLSDAVQVRTPSTSSGSPPTSSTRSAAGCSRSNWVGVATTTRSRRSAVCCGTDWSTAANDSTSAPRRSARWRPELRGGAGWSCYQQLRAIYAGTASLRERRTLAEKVIASLPSCPIPEVARLGRTPRAWRSQVLAHFDTDGLSNGGTEAINMFIEKAGRLSHGYRNCANYRLWMLLDANGTRGRRYTARTT